MSACEGISVHEGFSTACTSGSPRRLKCFPSGREMSKSRRPLLEGNNTRSLGRLRTRGETPGSAQLYWSPAQSARAILMYSLSWRQLWILQDLSRFMVLLLLAPNALAPNLAPRGVARTQCIVFRYTYAVFLAADGSRHSKYQPMKQPTILHDPPPAFRSSSQVWWPKVSRGLPIRARPQTAKEALLISVWAASSHLRHPMHDRAAGAMLSAGSQLSTRMSRGPGGPDGITARQSLNPTSCPASPTGTEQAWPRA